MAKRYPAPPKLLLFMNSAIISAFALIYGTNLGWLSIHMMYLYAFFIVYYFTICKGDKVACCYTVAGTVTSSVFLLAMKYLDNIIGAMIGIITAYFVAFMTDLIVKTDWRYFSLGDFDLSSFPIERSIQFMFDQHVPVSDATPAPTAETETSKRESEVKSEKSKKKGDKTPLSRKEKKAESKKQKKDK